MRGGSVDLPDEMEKSQSSASTSPCLSPVRHAQVFPLPSADSPQLWFPLFLSLTLHLSLLLYIIRFELVLPAPLLILIPFQEVAPSAAHQSVRHTLQLQGAPCRRARSQGGLQGELQCGNYPIEGELQNINRNSDTGFVAGNLLCNRSCRPLCRVLICSAHNSACSE